MRILKYGSQIQSRAFAGFTCPHGVAARAAATQAVPGGKVGEVEQETGEGAVVYGVAVTTPDGSQVEVHLDKDFHVLGAR